MTPNRFASGLFPYTLQADTTRSSRRSAPGWVTVFQAVSVKQSNDIAAGIRIGWKVRPKFRDSGLTKALVELNTKRRSFRGASANSMQLSSQWCYTTQVPGRLCQGSQPWGVKACRSTPPAPRTVSLFLTPELLGAVLAVVVPATGVMVDAAAQVSVVDGA